MVINSAHFGLVAVVLDEAIGGCVDGTVGD
jgi:hypothetical protein